MQKEDHVCLLQNWSVSTPVGIHFRLSTVDDNEAEMRIEDIPFTRCDMVYALGLVSMFMSKLGMIHWTAVGIDIPNGNTRLETVLQRRMKYSRLKGFCDSNLLLLCWTKVVDLGLCFQGW